MSETISPTTEFVARYREAYDAPVVDQQQVRRAARLTTLLERMHRQGTIGDLEYKAAVQYIDDHDTANRHKAITPSYGMRHAEGTPVAQQANADDSHDPLDRKRIAWQRIARAHFAIGSRRTIDCLVFAMEPDASLEKIGRDVLGHTNRPQAKSAAQERIASALETLVQHYGIERRRAIDRT